MTGTEIVNLVHGVVISGAIVLMAVVNLPYGVVILGLIVLMAVVKG